MVKNNEKKHKYNSKRLIIIYGTGIWIYGLVVYDVLTGGFGDLPEPGKLAFAFSTYVPFLIVYFIAVAQEKPEKRKELIGHNDYNFRSEIMKRDAIHAFVAIFGAIILVIATFVVIGWEDHKSEFTSWFTTCERDSSRTVTLPVDKVLESDSEKITVHNVTYNVPQNSKRPTSYSYKCEKATLVEVTIERKASGDTSAREKIRPSDFTLQHKNDSTTHPKSSIDEYDYYADRESIQILDRSIDEDTEQEHGWLVFSIHEDSSNKGNVLIYGEYPYSGKPSITLPNPRDN